MTLQELIILIFSEEVISGVLTGLIVGLILWTFEVRRENKLVKHRYEREIAVLREKLYFVNYHADVIRLYHLVDSQPVFVEEIIDIIQESPLDLMERYAGHNKELAAFLHELKNKYLEVRKEAVELDILMTYFIRQDNAEHQISKTHDAKYKTFFIGKIYNWGEDEIGIFMDDVVINEKMRKLYTNFEKKHCELIKEYLNRRRDLIQYSRELEGRIVK